MSHCLQLDSLIAANNANNYFDAMPLEIQKLINDEKKVQEYLDWEAKRDEDNRAEDIEIRNSYYLDFAHAFKIECETHHGVHITSDPYFQELDHKYMISLNNAMDSEIDLWSNLNDIREEMRWVARELDASLPYIEYLYELSCVSRDIPLHYQGGFSDE